MQNNFYKTKGKRVFDMIVSFIGLILLFPLFLAVITVIKLTSDEDSFFIQKRVGQNFKEFELYKFRSMKDGKGLSVTSANDPRITAFGRFLRKTKIDELPQLLNVLKGDMSLVGPRPEVKKYVDLKKDEYKKVLSVKPGITDLATIKFRDEEDILDAFDDKEGAYLGIILPQKIKLYNRYIDNISFKNDIDILIKTLKVL